MNRDQYEARVRNLEAYARLHPRLYLWRVGLLAAAGYLYLGLVMVLLGLGTIPIVVMVVWHPNYLTIKLAVVLLPITLGLSWIILRALWVRLDPPQGLAIHPPDAPALFAELGELTRRLDAPRFHQVLLNGEFNASVVQIPRLGPLGWHKNYLSLGLPLLEGLAPAEFQAVLAHEFAHLSRNHSRFSGWIYRVRQAWNRVFESLATKAQSGAGLLVKFFQWYAPYFNAYSFVLARANEYEADRCACSLTSPQALGQSLIRTQVHSRQLAEDFWPAVYRQVRFQAAPPERVFHQLAENLGQPPPRSMPPDGWGRRWPWIPTIPTPIPACATASGQPVTGWLAPLRKRPARRYPPSWKRRPPGIISGPVWKRCGPGWSRIGPPACARNGGPATRRPPPCASSSRSWKPKRRPRPWMARSSGRMPSWSSTCWAKRPPCRSCTTSWPPLPGIPERISWPGAFWWSGMMKRGWPAWKRPWTWSRRPWRRAATCCTVFSNAQGARTG